MIVHGDNTPFVCKGIHKKDIIQIFLMKIITESSKLIPSDDSTTRYRKILPITQQIIAHITHYLSVSYILIYKNRQQSIIRKSVE